MKRIILLLLLFSISTVQLVFAQSEESNFYDTDVIQDIKITIDQEDWSYLLDSLRVNGDDMLLGKIAINGNELSDIGFRYQESRSFSIGDKRNSLYIKLNYISKDRNHQGHETIKLSSALRDPSLIRQVLSYEIARDYMPAPRANYAKVYINDEYYGLFVNVEAVEDDFLEKNFGSSTGTFIRCNPDRTKKAPQGCNSDVYGSLQHDTEAKCYLPNFSLLSETGWDDLMELTRTLNNTPQLVGRRLDIDQTLWMLAFNNVLVNLNSYTGQGSPNYYLYKDQRSLFHPIVYDLNLSFGSYKNIGSGSDLSLQELQQLDPLLHADNEDKPLISQLLEDDMNRKMYISHIRTLMKDWVWSDRVKERAEALQALIKLAFEEDKHQFYTQEEFDKSLTETIGQRSRIPGLVSFMEERASFLRRHATMTVLPPKVASVDVGGREPLSSERVKDFQIQAKVERFPQTVKIYYRFFPENDFLEAMMYDDGNNKDGEEGDEMYGVRITPPAGVRSIEYYIVAENTKAISYEPTRYMYERHRANLDELNQ